MDLSSQVRTAIIAQSLPTPSSDFLTTLTTSRSPPPPLPSLIATARARLLACDLCNNSVLDSSTASFPLGVDNVNTAEQKLRRDVHVQVLDIENISLSRWEQIEELEAIERGEKTKGREIIRVAAEEDENGPVNDGSQMQQHLHQRPTQQSRPSTAPFAGKNTTHKLVMQDCKGKEILAMELRRVDKIGVGRTMMGEKMVLKAGTVIARGMFLLSPDTCLVLGGKIDAWHKSWVESRLARLKDAISTNPDT